METAVLTNTMLVQECFKDFTDGNIPALLDNLADNVKWNTPGPKSILPWAGNREGKASVGEFFSKLDKETTFTRFEAKEFIENGDKVVALGIMEGTSKRTGKSSQSEWAMIFTVRNGKITKFQEYSDTYAAVQAYQ